ncbi:MAG TPA: efflux RND transporter permease subunit, partial [Bacteroidetes bacterium]|nr:efflux RND transporter permease subunit [Bacteroidota bacterium]
GLSAMDVMTAVQRANTMIPTGAANIGDISYNVNARGMIQDVEDFNNIVVKFENGAPVYVRDIGEAKDAGAIQTNLVRINGKRQVYIPIYKRPGANTIQAVEGVKNALVELKSRLPKDVNLDVIFDQSNYVRSAIGGLATAGISGLVLITLVLILFLGSIRSVLTVIIVLPIGVLTAFIGLYFAGESINSMTLGGLALALGLLVDNAIVVLENTDRHLRMGKDSFSAALAGVTEVAMPMLVSTLVIIIVFSPIIFLTGVAKYLFSSLALSVSFAMLGSYIFSLTLVPITAAFLFRNYLPNSENGNKKPSLFERFFAGLTNLYERTLEFFLGIRLLTIGLATGLLVIALFLAQGLGYELFPKMDVGQMEIYTRFEPGTRLEKSETYIANIEAAIKEEMGEELNMMVSNIGVFYDWPAAYTPNSGTQDGFIKVQLKEGHSSSTFALEDKLRRRLNADFPGVEFSFNTGGIVTAALNYGLSSPIDIQIRGNKLEIAHEIAEKIREKVRTVSGTRDVRILQRLNQPQIDIDI